MNRLKSTNLKEFAEKIVFRALDYVFIFTRPLTAVKYYVIAVIFIRATFLAHWAKFYENTVFPSKLAFSAIWANDYEKINVVSMKIGVCGSLGQSLRNHGCFRINWCFLLFLADDYEKINVVSMYFGVFGSLFPPRCFIL